MNFASIFCRSTLRMSVTGCQPKLIIVTFADSTIKTCERSLWVYGLCENSIDKFGMGFFIFLKKPKFYLHLLLGVIMSVLLLWLVLMSLDLFTRHGNVYLVPDFTGKSLATINQNDFDEYFSFTVIDSVYDQNREKGTIVMQSPLPGAKVKMGRHIYLTLVAQLPEKVLMPNLKNLSLRQALVTLDSKGLTLGELEYVEYFARNAVIDQLMEGEPIEPETEIVTGSIINLVLGKGDVLTKVPMPMLIGLTKSESNALLHYNSLNVGKEYFLENYSPIHSRVFKTDPATITEEMLVMGEKVNLWYRSDEFFNFDEFKKQFQTDSLRNDTIVLKNYLIEDER
jgi:beta-lactam-binding protein with PASTA domain